MQKPKVIFLPIKTNQQKIECICHHAQKHFNQDDKVLIIAPSELAVQYLDELLWKYPNDSFLPHVSMQTPCHDKIVITTFAQNLNHATIVLNLCLDYCPIANNIEIIYELYDETTPEKLEQSKRRKHMYSQNGLVTVDSSR